MNTNNQSTRVYLFASVLRSDTKSRPIMRRVKATSEKEARRQLVRDHILAFAGCLPARDGGVFHV